MTTRIARKKKWDRIVKKLKTQATLQTGTVKPSTPNAPKKEGE